MELTSIYIVKSTPTTKNFVSRFHHYMAYIYGERLMFYNKL